MRTDRSDFSYEYLDEEFNPRRIMLNQDESCSRHLNQLPRRPEDPEMCQQISERPLTDLSQPPKVVRGDSQERPRAPSKLPSDPPRSSPEPPSREYANGSRGSTISGRPARAPGTPGTTQPQGMIVYVLTLPHGRSRLPALSGLPPRRTHRGRRIDWAAPTAADPETRISRPAIEKGPFRFYLRAFRRTVQPG